MQRNIFTPNTMTNIDVGFLEKTDNWRLHPRFFPSKVGGKPSWLNLIDIPRLDAVSCSICQEPLIMLCQVYAPFEESDNCFHRSLFIFICRNSGCCQPNKMDNLKIFRCQLRRKNDFFPYDPPEEENKKDPGIKNLAALCTVCGLKGPSHCSKCKKVNYCSRSHQVLDWKKGHKEECGTEKPVTHFNLTESGKSLLFDEWELLMEEETEEQKSNVNIESEMDKMKKLLENKSAGSMNDVPETEIEQYANDVPGDKIFNKFTKRVARHPDQVLRYDRGGEPLWISDKPTIGLKEVPNCTNCGGKRQFEFQIMPQLLNFINIELDVNSIDWGILAVYTCKQSCSDGPAYKTEYIFKQDISEENKR